MDRKKIRKQIQNLRNKALSSKKLSPPPLPAKPKNIDGAMKVESFSSKQVDDAAAKAALKAEHERFMREMAAKRSSQKPGGCGGCRRKSGS